MDLKGAEIRNIKELCREMNSTNKVPVRINIPFYQRPYKWDEEHIDNLIDDFQKNKMDNEQMENVEQKEEYFVGSVVLVKNANGTERSDVIDGQQRITTVFLMNYLRLILMRAYIEECLCVRRTNLEGMMRKYEESYHQLFGVVNFEKYEKLRENIIERLDEINDMNEEDKQELYDSLLSDYQKQMCLPMKNLSNIEQYCLEYSKLQKACIRKEELALKYSRDVYNEKMKDALSRIVVLVRNDENPEILLWEEDEKDLVVKQYMTAIKEEFIKVYEYADDVNQSPLQKAKKMLEVLDEMIDKIKFCVIVTGNERDAYTLFEVLNDRAMAIEDIDLIKNLYYKQYCNKSGEQDSVELDRNIEQLDNVWSDEVFTKEFGSEKIKLTSYLGTIYLTANENIVLNKVEKYREVLEQEYFDRYYQLPDKPYTYENVYRDVMVYRMIKEILEAFDLKTKQQEKNIISAECDVKKSITYKAMKLIHGLKHRGVMPALSNLILQSFVEQNKGSKKECDMREFSNYLRDLIEDKEHKDERFYHIHKWAYELWKAVLYSKDYGCPRELAKEIISHVNFATYEPDRISLRTELQEKMQRQFKDWIQEWRYGKSSEEVKAKVLFINLYQYEKEENVLRLPMVRNTFQTENLHLDHMEAANPSEVEPAKYFEPKDINDKRENHVNGIGNFMILDYKDNIEKTNKPLYDALKHYEEMRANHWMISEVKEMLEDKEYSKLVTIGERQYPVPTEKFFSERRARLLQYFEAILKRKVDEKEVRL